MQKQYRNYLFYGMMTMLVIIICLADAVKTKYETVNTFSIADKKVAITFDDGPNPDYTACLLDGLKERGVSATFFLLGKEAEQYPELVLRMAKEGHLVATHSYEHVNLCNLSDADAIEQVVKTNTIIEEITGECPQFIRPPYGCWKEDLDYKTEMMKVLWSVDPTDWNTKSSAVIVQRVRKVVQDGDIILLHDASQSSVDAAFELIDSLKKEGYCFVTVDELVLD